MEKYTAQELLKRRADYLAALGIPDDPFDGEALSTYIAGG